MRADEQWQSLWMRESRVRRRALRALVAEMATARNGVVFWRRTQFQYTTPISGVLVEESVTELHEGYGVNHTNDSLISTWYRVPGPSGPFNVHLTDGNYVFR